MATSKTLREFRHSIAVLKRKGLISPSIDARSVKPSKSFEKTISKYGRVLSGEAVAVKLSPAETRKKKEQGYRIAAPKGLPRRTIVPVAKGDRVTVSHGRLSTRLHTGLNTIDIEPDVNDVNELQEWIEDNKRRLNAMKKKGQFFGFKLKGYSSISIYTNIQSLFDELLSYDIFTNYAEQGPDELRNAIESVQIVSIANKSDWAFGGHLSRIKKPRTQRARQRKQKFDKGSSAYKQSVRDQRADAARAYRAKLKASKPAQYEAYKKAAQKRAASSRGKKKK